MKLRKDNWEKVRYGDYVNHIENTETNSDKRANARYVSVENIESGNFKITSWYEEEMPTFFRTFKQGQILFGKRRAYQKKVAIADFDGICSPHIWALETKSDNLSQAFLSYLMLSDNFYKYVNANSAGTMSPYLKWPQLSSYTFVLPPLEEQKQIAALFQSIDTAIEQVDRQEKNLKSLQHRLSNGLVRKSPVFGNLLSGINCKLCKFEDITDCIETHDKKPLESGITRFVGLECIETENFHLQSFGNIENGTTFTKRFSKGDVLFGKRRAYLKKVAVADFDGICSSDILVFRAKENKMLADLLPYYVSSDVFIQHAVMTSAGSLSPRTKWKDLAALEIAIPELKTQKVIMEIFQQLQIGLDQLNQQKNTLKNLKQQLLNEILG
ncbi:MAG: restriction endonuclease subunit S [Desulfamplus sp.]